MTASTNNWKTTWIRPVSTTACANTSGGDQPDSSAAGVLPSAGGGFLQYRPNTTATGDAWNRESNFETSPCPAFAVSNEGAWSLRLEADATHFVVLPVFTLDAENPSSGASSPAFSTGNTFTVNYSSSDAGPSGLKEVELWVMRPADGSFSLAATDTTPGSPSFSYTASAGDGTYRFYTRARDNAGNFETAPASADTETIVDTAK